MFPIPKGRTVVTGHAVAEAPPSIPALAIVVGTTLCMVAAFTHWQFRTGWQMTTGRLAPSSGLRDLFIHIGYAALPNAIAFGSATLALVLMKIAGDSYTQASAYGVVVLGFVFLGSIGWAIKEFHRPTLRRTPSWLDR
jgi:hypothetical protein